jgi:CubicO group peptidase (beta-lactamase class C family)
MNFSSSFALALLLAPQQPSVAAKSLQDELRAACTSFQTEHGIVGMSVAVLEGDELAFDEAFGFRDREAKSAAQASTLYRLASVSKTITATIAMQLVEEKKLDLDADVHGYVSELDKTWAPLTLRQILSHTSGIRHYRDDRDDGGTAHRSTAEALALFVHDPLLFAPGAKYSYSTHAFTVAVAAIERASKEDFPALVRERVAAKYAPSLSCEIASESKPDRSALYGKDDHAAIVRLDPREDLSWKYGGGGLESAAHDVARFAHAVAEAKLVTAASRDLMWTRAKLADGSSTDYGLGWGVSADGNAIQHSGSQQGASSCLCVLRREHIVIVVLSNTEGSNAPGLVPRLRELAASKR